MAIAGPRLDRPSAVGTEGRPRATSLTVAAVAVAASFLATMFALDGLAAVAVVGLAVALTVAGLALVTRDRFAALVVGHLCFHPGAAILVVLLLGSVSVPGGLALAGYLLALFGVAGTWANTFERDRLSAAVRAAPISYAATLLWIVALTFAFVVAAATAAFVGAQIGARDAAESLYGFLLFVALAAGTVRAALWALPLVELSPEPDRPRRRRQLASVRRATAAVAAGAVGSIVLAATVSGPGGIADLAREYPAVGAALTGLSSPFVLGPVVLVGAGALVATVVGAGAREVASQLDRGNYGVLAGAFAGFVLGLLSTVYLYLPLVALFYPGLVGIAAFAPLVVVVCGLVAVAAMDAGLVPNRAAGPALAATGLLVAAIGAALADLAAPLVFAPVAGAVLVWDLSTFGLGVTVELGHRPDTRRLELYHGVLSVGVGLAAVAAATSLDWLRRSLGGAVGAWPAVASAVLGAIVLAIALHRRRRAGGRANSRGAR